MRFSLLFIFFTLIYSSIFSPTHAGEKIWVLINTSELRLKVIQGNKILAVMDNIAIGQNGAGMKTHKGDDITPLGTYTIGWVNNKSRFHKFYGFTYPSLQNAKTALLNGFLNNNEYNKILRAHRKKQVPPQNTMLGGHIGIHGLGAADIKIHKLLNWTHGCIALTNRQIDQLARWVGKGTMVTVE